jgi:hypothetical protein
MPNIIDPRFFLIFSYSSSFFVAGSFSLLMAVLMFRRRAVLVELGELSHQNPAKTFLVFFLSVLAFIGITASILPLLLGFFYPELNQYSPNSRDLFSSLTGLQLICWINLKELGILKKDLNTKLFAILISFNMILSFILYSFE